jgi:hypothetical protein
MKRFAKVAVVAAAIPLAIAVAASAGTGFSAVHPGVFDPAHTFLASGAWEPGIGCPTNAKTFDGTSTGGYTDPACTTGDSNDHRNQGLLLAKTGPTPNFAAAVADLNGVKGIVVTELGYDIRKARSATDSSGSHCGAGAPRFDISTSDGNSYFLGCNSPSADVVTVGNGWLRLRWGTAGTLMAFPSTGGGPVNISGKTLTSVQIVFDEGQDTGPDNFGLAVLDNIDVNGTLVGRAPVSHDQDQESRK